MSLLKIFAIGWTNVWGGGTLSQCGGEGGYVAVSGDEEPLV